MGFWHGLLLLRPVLTAKIVGELRCQFRAGWVCVSGSHWQSMFFNFRGATTTIWVFACFSGNCHSGLSSSVRLSARNFHQHPNNGVFRPECPPTARRTSGWLGYQRRISEGVPTFLRDSSACQPRTTSKENTIFVTAKVRRPCQPAEFQRRRFSRSHFRGWFQPRGRNRDEQDTIKSNSA